LICSTLYEVKPPVEKSLGRIGCAARRTTTLPVTDKIGRGRSGSAIATGRQTSPIA
jgi:hypothetical protein